MEKIYMEKNQAETMAEEVIKFVVDMLSQKRYEELEGMVEMDVLSVRDVRELVDAYLEQNNLSHIDCFDAACNFHPQNEYHQIEFYHYSDDSGFAVDYDLTTDKEINDLTLQMEFIYEDERTLKAKLTDLHVL